MTVLSVAYPFAPVGLSATGGAEQILALLDRGLIRAGRRSVVIACEGSSVAGELLAQSLPRGIVDDHARKTTYERWRAAIVAAIERYPIDAVHMHGVDFFEYAPVAGPPLVVTLHLPLSFYPADRLQSMAARASLVCVSPSQRRSCLPGLGIAAVIGNGVDLDDRVAPFRHGHDYVMALGRICPEKGFHLAVDAADRAGVPLYLAGQVFPYDGHLRYFERELAPRLRSPHRFLGPLGRGEKLAYLAAARCLLAPSVVAETSSLVAMEAMSAGTPVIAFPSGALADLVDHGRTGFLVHNVDAMAEAIGKAAAISRHECRRVARDRFPAARMIGEYLDLYDRSALSRAQPPVSSAILSP